MKNIISVLIIGFFLIVASAFADDVSIDSNGNVTTGISNTNANLEVSGASTEIAIFGSTSGSGAAGVYGVRSDNSNYGMLGYDNYGVFGYSASGFAGYFQGAVGLTGDLSVGGSILSGETDPSVNALGKATLSCSTNQIAKWNGTIWVCAADVDTNTNLSETQVDAYAGNNGYLTSETDPTVNALGKSTLSCSNNEVAKWNGSAWACAVDNAGAGASYQGVVVVAKSGGDYTSPLDAMNNVSTGDAWCGTPSSSNPCLVQIMPGIYDLGSSGLAMQSYVDIEGSGENTTTITSTHSSGAYATAATVSGADNAEIRFLVVENLGSSFYSIAIYNGTASPDITNVTATASGGISGNYGVHNNSSSPAMTNVIAIATGGSVKYGVWNESSSPAMTNVIVTTSGSGSNFGVYNFNTSSPAMTNVIVTASGIGTNYAIINDSSSPVMTNVKTTASGGTDSYGVYNYASSPVMTNITATASGGSFNYGVRNESSSSNPIIKTSSISGTTNSISNASLSTVKVGASMLEGSVTGTGFTCVGVYNESFAALTTSCL